GMFGKKKRAPLPKGQGAAAAKQMGLFVDFNPEDMTQDMDDPTVDDADLEAELSALTGGKTAGGRLKQKAPLPMENIARMAEECMKDIYDDDDDDDDLEDDEDLLVTLAPPAVPGSLQHTLEERLSMYRTAVAHAKASGESSKARRYDRGIQVAMLICINMNHLPPTKCMFVYRRFTALLGCDCCVSLHLLGCDCCVSLCVCVFSSDPTVGEATKAMLLGRQREYKVAALKAKQQGDMEQVKLYFRTSKVTVLSILEKDGVKVVRLEDVIYFLYLISHNLSSVALSLGVISALSGPEKEPGPGQTSSPNPPASTPPAPSAVPAQPKDVLEALEQRRDRYQEACAQAKASGDDRKARMHERIAKQYQSAIRTHKAGRAVNYAELPVPPGFHPIPGQEGGVGAEQGFSAMLEAANKLASEETIVTGEEEGENEEVNYFFPSNIVLSPIPQHCVLLWLKAVFYIGNRKSFQEHVVPLLPTALQQLDFVEGRRQQYMKAALQAKQKNDMDAARTLLRTAKGLEPLIDAVKAGKHVDISKVPSPPGDEDEDFILVHHSEVQISEKADEVYTQLAKMLKEQYEKCMTYSKQFTHLGNIAETTKFEKMAESCKKSLEMLKLSQSKRLDPPKHHFEERTYHTVRIFPDLSSTEMVVVVVRGMNLPAPSGIATNDLDAYVKFDFPYPSTEQPQKHRTAVVKNTNSPEFNQGFTLNINRNHRGFRRVVQSKGLKLELLHKGGFLRSDKPIGTAHIKLEKLETESEVREIVEVIDGRKPTGGRVEVRVRLREPLSGQDLQTTTERWLVLDQSQVHLE
uniref:Coiled-coil and C2 domain-containing protein 1B n=1 Tax=Oncorhynchus tshawytscha TaxID=74940 RepID=A0A8C8IQM3_ONCTS